MKWRIGKNEEIQQIKTFWNDWNIKKIAKFEDECKRE